jgi:L-fuculose-phosphate aldolase
VSGEPSAPSLLGDARESVATAARRLAAGGLVTGTSGNLSVREGERIAVSPTGAVLATLRAGDVAVVDRAGTHLAGPHAATSELGLHLGIYDRYGVGAVVHTHPPIATALGTVLDVLPCVYYEAFRLGGDVRVAPYATYGSPELAAAVVEALDGRRAALMAHHGAVTHGDDLAGAVAVTELLEWIATLYWRASCVGTPRALSPSDLQAVSNTMAATGYGSRRPATGRAG